MTSAVLRPVASLFITALLLAVPHTVPGAELDGLDDFIRGAMREWKTPGLAVAVVRDGKVIHSQGYGFRDVDKQLPVTPQTLFAIGSITKSFTAAGLGMLVDEGQLDWDQPIRNYIPEFQLHDRVATEQMTARDLLTHRSGLPRHDFVWYGSPDASRGELLKRLRHLEPSKAFRSAWQYQNLMYMTAGVLTERISGKPWEEFTRQRLLEPLGMANTNFSVADSQQSDNFALPFNLVKNEPRRVPFHNIDAMGPAGSINSNVEAMIRYVQFLIEQGKYDGKQPLSKGNARAMQTGQVAMPDENQSPRDEELGPISYGLGLIVGAYRGQPYIQHGGSIDGFVASLSFMPRQKAGVIVLTNLSGFNPAPTIIERNVYDRLLGQKPVDWSQRLRAVRTKALANRGEAKQKENRERKSGTRPSHALADYAGTYEHPAYGRVQVRCEGEKLQLSTASGLSTPLGHYHYDIFQADEFPPGSSHTPRITFLYDQRGTIDRLTAPIEPAVSDIAFTRVKDDATPKAIAKAVTGAIEKALAKVDPAKSAAATWTPERQMTVRRVSDVRPSPDGKRVVYTVTSAVMTPQRSEFVAQIYLANADGSGTVQLTHADKSSTDPQWSPDGKSLAFASKRAGKSNLYLLRLDGGESEQLTDLQSDVGQFAWSPRGDQLAFTMTDPPTEDEEKRKKAKDDWRFVDEDLKLHRLYVMPIAKSADGKREPRLLTKGNYSLASSGRGGTNGFDWSPDGAAIVFSHRKSDKADDWTTADISVVQVATGEQKSLVATAASEYGPLFSPDGKTIVFVASDAPVRWAGDYRLRLVSAAGGPTRDLPATHDHQPAPFGWSADGARVFFTEARGTVSRVSAMHVASGKIDDLNSGSEVIRSIDVNRSGTTFGFTLEGPHRAPEAHVTAVDKFQPLQISRANADLPPLPFGKVEVVRWKSADGKEIEGILTYPAGYQSGQRVPLLLQIHGGPTGVFLQGFNGGSQLYPNAAFASRGYAVLQPNPRGSSGYGKDFRFANYQDWGGGDYRDLMAGVEHVIALGVADPDRLGVMGWSYGGYMTSWIVTQTRRFKAASIGAAVTHLTSFTGTADIPGFLPDYLGSQPWNSLDLYRSRSPLLNAKGVTTPSIIQHGESDARVPVSQGYEMYNALQSQGVPVRMLLLPRQPHGPNEPKMTLQTMRSNLEWFEQHVRKVPATSLATPGQ